VLLDLSFTGILWLWFRDILRVLLELWFRGILRVLLELWFRDIESVARPHLSL
jgi:hypothetical protein